MFYNHSLNMTYILKYWISTLCINFFLSRFEELIEYLNFENNYKWFLRLYSRNCILYFKSQNTINYYKFYKSFTSRREGWNCFFTMTFWKKIFVKNQDSRFKCSNLGILYKKKLFLKEWFSHQLNWPRTRRGKSP